VCLARRGHEAGAQRMRAEVALEARAPNERVHEVRDVAAADTPLTNAPAGLERAEQRPVDEAGRQDPRLDRSSRTEGLRRHIGDRDRRAFARLIGLRFPDEHEQAARLEPDVRDIERRVPIGITSGQLLGGPAILETLTIAIDDAFEITPFLDAT